MAAKINPYTNIAIIAGARPNFMKVAPLSHRLTKKGVRHFIINTGQHKDFKMSKSFFREFKISPKYTLLPSQQSHEKQKADIMKGLEDCFKKEKPTLVMVVGDVNSSLYASLVAHKMNIKLAHVEAGLRSHNLKMPEETNRIMIDKLSDILFASEPDAIQNLKKEKLKGSIYLVGNIMLDTLSKFAVKAKVKKEKYYLTTLHRAENVDKKNTFAGIIDALAIIAQDAPIYLPIHPRTKARAQEFGLIGKMKKSFKILPPLSYSDSVSYQKSAQLILTDSGGVQEEASFLGIPCVTLRTETERPVTVTLGTNIVAGVETEGIVKAYKKIKAKRLKKKVKIPLWDGKTAERIIDILLKK